jgi:hypothetical protein
MLVANMKVFDKIMEIVITKDFRMNSPSDCEFIR